MQGFMLTAITATQKYKVHLSCRLNATQQIVDRWMERTTSAPAIGMIKNSNNFNIITPIKKILLISIVHAFSTLRKHAHAIYRGFKVVKKRKFSVELF